MQKQFNFNAADFTADDQEKILKDLGIEYERRDDGTFFVPHDIKLSERGLKKLPNLTRVEVGGHFFCDCNELTTLEGSPYHVHEDVWADSNELTTLRGATQKVGGTFYCISNDLKSLAHAPTEFGELTCDHGDFGSWDAIPEKLRSSPEEIMAEKREFEHKIKTAVNVTMPKTKTKRIKTTQRKTRLND